MTALRHHFATPHIAEFMRAVSAALIAPADVSFHTIERTRSLANLGRRSSS